MLDLAAKFKHSSLFVRSVSEEKKSLKKFLPGACLIELFTVVINTAV